MDIIIPLLIVSVLIGIPTWLIVHTVNKADKSTIIYSPEEVTRRLHKGFYLSFWGIEDLMTPCNIGRCMNVNLRCLMY